MHLGRATMATLLAIQNNAELLGFGTGSSRATDGKWEAEEIRDLILNNFLMLSDFSAFQNINLYAFQKRVREIVEVDIVSKNTAQEIECAAEIFRRKGVEKAIFVTDPSHGSRVFKNACETFLESEKFKGILEQFSVAASHIPYSGHAADVVVVDPSNPLNPLLQKLMKASKETQTVLLSDLQALIAKHGLD